MTMYKKFNPNSLSGVNQVQKERHAARLQGLRIYRSSVRDPKTGDTHPWRSVATGGVVAINDAPIEVPVAANNVAPTEAINLIAPTIGSAPVNERAFGDLLAEFLSGKAITVTIKLSGSSDV